MLLLSGCAVSDYMFSNSCYKIEYDSYTTNKPLKKEYCLGTGQSNLDPFLKSEIEGHITKILSEQGYVRIPKKEPGTYTIGYIVDLKEVNKMVTGVYPIQGITGTSTTGKATGRVDVYGNSAYGSARGTETTRYNRGTVGWGSYQKPATYYAKSISMQGWILGSPDDVIPTEILWKINAGTWSGGEDLRKAIPFILAGISKSINTNSKGVKSVDVYPSNPIYKKIIE